MILFHANINLIRTVSVVRCGVDGRLVHRHVVDVVGRRIVRIIVVRFVHPRRLGVKE